MSDDIVELKRGGTEERRDGRSRAGALNHGEGNGQPRVSGGSQGLLNLDSDWGIY